METLKHLTGLCGEPHINIFILVLIFIAIKSLYKYIFNDITY